MKKIVVALSLLAALFMLSTAFAEPEPSGAPSKAAGTKKVRTHRPSRSRSRKARPTRKSHRRSRKAGKTAKARPSAAAPSAARTAPRP